MDDLDIVHRISALSDEEHALERSHTGQALSGDELARRGAIEVALDQCWTSSGNDERDAALALTRMRRWRARRASSRATSNDPQVSKRVVCVSCPKHERAEALPAIGQRCRRGSAPL